MNDRGGTGARKRLAAGLGLCATLAGGVAIAQRATPNLEAEAPLVRLDVYAVGADGQPVTDLSADEVEIREDNVPQAIASFERVAVAPAAVAPVGQAVVPSSAPARAPAAGERARIVVVYLDTYHTDGAAARAIYQPLVRLLDSAAGPDDVVAVMTSDMSVRDVTFNRKASSIESAMARFRDAAQRDDADYRKDADQERYSACFPEQGTQVCRDRRDPDGPRARQTTVSYAGVAREMAARRREQRVMTGLADLVRTLEGLNEARKAVLVVSNGWLLYRESPRLARLGGCDGAVTTDKEQGRTADSADRTICEADRRRLSELDLQYDFKRMVDGANRATVSFYPIEARGMASLGSGGAAQLESAAGDARPPGARADALRTLAENTGGLAIANANDLPAALGRMTRDLSSYYLIGYRSTNTKADGGYRRVSVAVRRRGVTARTRPGYRALTAGERDRQLTQAVQAGQTIGGTLGAVQIAIKGLGDLPDLASVRSRVAYGPVAGGRVHLWAVAEIDISTSRQGPWLGGGTVDASLTGPDNAALATAEGALAGRQRAVLMDLGEIERAGSPTTLQVRLQPSGDGTRLQDQLSLAPLGRESDVGVPLLLRRGPTTAGRYIPTADPRFQRTERVRLELPRSSPPASFSAALLDRTGTPMSVSVTTSTRTDGAVTWAIADLSLAPLAHGDYVMRMSVDGQDALTALRVVP